jgi:glucose/arabinose dehydrogenase
VPPDNPFAGQPTARGEIWAFGLRNPYRCAFDRLTGELWAGDVWQNQWEEIDLIVAGGNYGWRKYEGNHEFNAADPAPANVRFPVHEYEHTGGRCSITGGYPYRGSALDGFAGRYFFADYCSGELWALERGVDGSYRSAALGSVPGNPTSFGEDADGELYLTSFDGRIYKLVPGG